MVILNLDKCDCENVLDFMECYFFQNIRDDDSIDNIDYVRSLLRIMDEFKRVSNETNENTLIGSFGDAQFKIKLKDERCES